MTSFSDSKTLQADGRRQRSERNKHLIVKAMMALIRGGDMDPSAARVAEKAGVGVRTVFRHFEDMDTLYAEMTRQVQAELEPIFDHPFESTNWKDLCSEACIRRTAVYDRIMLLRVCGAGRRFQSDYLQANYDFFHQEEFRRLKELLPPDILKDASLVNALDASCSFDVWRRLRQDRKLSFEAAQKTMLLMISALIENK